jgi:molybdopterin converting factor small subunit
MGMRISLFLHTTLQKRDRNGLLSQMDVDLPPGSTLTVLLNQEHIDLDVENTLLVVNGRSAELTHQLLDGDQVHLIPAISGGACKKSGEDDPIVGRYHSQGFHLGLPNLLQA